MGVQKSLYAIAGLGLAGCITLLLMLDHTVANLERKPGSLFETELAAEFGAQLAKPAKVKELHCAGRAHLHVHLVVATGQPREAIADRAGARLWQAVARGGRDVVEIVIYVDDDVGGARLVRQVAPRRGVQRSEPNALFTGSGSPGAPR